MNKIDQKEALAIDMDSTTHIQQAEKMEGLQYDYKGNWGLSSLPCSDEMGHLVPLVHIFT